MINLRIHFDSWLTYLDYDKINLTTCGKESRGLQINMILYKPISRKPRTIYNDSLEEKEVIFPPKCGN